MSTFTWVPSYTSEVEWTPMIREAKFGDGYAQRTGDGINNVPEKWSLTFDTIDVTQANAIIAFLKAQGGYQPFDWTNPDGGAGRYVCKTFRKVFAGFASRTVTCVFEQDFAP
jgi:phage-related protein